MTLVGACMHADMSGMQVTGLLYEANFIPASMCQASASVHHQQLAGTVVKPAMTHISTVW